MKRFSSILLLLLIVLSGCIYIPSSPTSPTSSVTVTGPLPVITNFSANPNTVAAGQRTLLSWSAVGAMSATIDNGEGSVATSGSRWVIPSSTPSSTTTYTMTATNPFGQTIATAKVNISGTAPASVLPVVNSFTASPTSVSSGGASTLSWNISNASSVSIYPYIGSVDPVSGSGVMTMGNVTTAFILTASNAAGSTTASATVAVPGSPTQSGSPWINSFLASPDVISSGGSTTLSWNVGGAQQVSLNNTTVNSSGTSVVSPASTTNYTLKAMDSSGNWVIQTLVVVVGQTQPSQGGQPVVLSLSPSESGSLVKNGQTYTESSNVCAGDTAQNLPSSAFLSFDISSIPANAIIENVVLDLGGYSISGNPSYTVSGYGNMGALEVYQTQYGPSANMGALSYGFPTAMVGSMRVNDLSGSPLQLDVTLDSAGNNIVHRLLSNGQGRCQFKLKFFTQTNWDGIVDQVCMATAVLKVTYSLPQ